MLGPAAGARHDEEGGEAEEAARPSQQNVGEPGQRRAGGEHGPFSVALGKEARRHLGRRQRARHDHLEGPHLGVGQGEGGRPQRQQHVDAVGEAVVDGVGESAGDQDLAPESGRIPRTGSHGALRSGLGPNQATMIRPLTVREAQASPKTSP